MGQIDAGSGELVAGWALLSGEQRAARMAIIREAVGLSR